MDAFVIALIDRMKGRALRNIRQDRADVLAILALDPMSEEVGYLFKAAKEVAFESTGHKSRIGISIGLDYAPCSMNCRFCSLGERWGLVRGSYVLPVSTIVKIVDTYVRQGYFQFVLRTTEFFDNELLASYAREVRAKVSGRYILVANTGEQTLESARNLKDAGFNAVYHTVRLREGIDTDFTVEERLESISNSRKAGLVISCGLDPIGPEHTDEEIADRLELYREVMQPAAVCTMKRVPVRGTPMYSLGEISKERHCQMIAVVRMVMGCKALVPMHPLSAEGLDCGCNHFSVEIGANPRDDDMENVKWYPFPPEKARELMLSKGFEIGTLDDFSHIFPYSL